MKRYANILDHANIRDKGKDCYYILSGWHQDLDIAIQECCKLQQKERALIIDELTDSGAIVYFENIDSYDVETMSLDDGNFYRCRAGGEVEWVILNDDLLDLSDDVTSVFCEDYAESENSLDELDIFLHWDQ